METNVIFCRENLLNRFDFKIKIKQPLYITSMVYMLTSMQLGVLRSFLNVTGNICKFFLKTKQLNSLQIILNQFTFLWTSGLVHLTPNRQHGQFGMIIKNHLVSHFLQALVTQSLKHTCFINQGRHISILVYLHHFNM